MRKFENPVELANYLTLLSDNEEEYKKHLKWKKDDLSKSFISHLDECVHQAECRICKFAEENKK